MEFQQFSWSAETISSLGIIFFTFLGAWGLRRQSKNIWEGETGRSVSIIWFSWFAFGHVVVFIYGLDIKSIALMINGSVRGLMHIPILVGLWKYKGFSKVERILPVFLFIFIIAMAFSTAKDIYFLVFSFGTILATLKQPIEVWISKDAGVLEIRLLLIYLVSNLFWVTYSFAIHNWILQLFSSMFFAIFALTIIVWLKCK